MILECCVDFQLINGACKPCIGRHGVNCTSPCRFGYFGFGCQQRCNCSDRQGCDRHTGCFDLADGKCAKSYSGEILGVVGVLFGIICLSVAGALTRRSKLYYGNFV
ncbi:cell death abnormality protein 1-like [Saccostrea echinata]|uniref:cell death abnormality protein 1-like n=1 Tax=Saccostrea echinata TaxID=191078 RepID=UPI002A809C11|nr:cell death abnormality protein 1-like [Saccostrea echinata]